MWCVFEAGDQRAYLNHKLTLKPTDLVNRYTQWAQVAYRGATASHFKLDG